MNPDYSAMIQKDGISARIELNGVPLKTWVNADAVQSSAVLNPWIRPNKNVLRIRLGWPVAEETILPVGSLSVRIVVVEDPEPAGGSRELVRWQWPEKEAVGKQPAVISLEFDVDNAPPSELWKLASEVQLTDSVRSEIFALLTSLQKALAGHDSVATMNLLAFKTSDLAKATYMSQQEAEDSHREFLEMVLGKPDFGMKPLEADDVEYHLVADKQVVWVTRANYAPVLQGKGFSVPVYVARVEGRWAVVR